MKRIRIKYWQELPLLVDSLKKANSQLVYDWQEMFNPSRAYTTSINFHDVRITFEGKYWKVATRLFQSVCVEYGLKLGIHTFLWFAEHTTVLRDSLLGDEEFNTFIRSNNGYEEVEEFVKNNKLVNWHGEDLEVYYNQRDMEMLQRLGMEVRPNMYQFRSKCGYYLPIDIKIRYNDSLMKWLRGKGADANTYQITHSPIVTIIGLEKRAIIDLATYLYKKEKLYELIIQWVDDPLATEYKIKIHNTTVLVKDCWREENKEYVEMSRELSSLSEYNLESFKLLDVLLNSQFDKEYGIELSDELYNKLNIPKDRLLSGLKHIQGNVYGKEEMALGSPVPLTVDAEALRIKTPYEYIKSGEYRGVMLSLLDDERYTNDTQELSILDTDIRVVLRKSSIPVEERDVDLYGIVKESKGVEVNLDDYPSVEFDVEQLPIDFKEGMTIKKRKLTGTDDDFKYVPYILDVEDGGDSLYVTYIDGSTLKVSHDDKYKRSRIVFKDSVGVHVREGIGELAELLLSLGTDTLGEYTDNLVSGEGTQVLIEEWLRAVVSLDTKNLYQLIQEFSISRVEESSEEEEFDIFEDIDLM